MTPAQMRISARFAIRGSNCDISCYRFLEYYFCYRIVTVMNYECKDSEI